MKNQDKKKKKTFNFHEFIHFTADLTEPLYIIKALPD